MAKAKGTTKSQGNKHDLDKFYTKDEIVETCLKFLQFDEYDCIIEPSAGSGAFSDKIDNVYAFDLLPENENIVQADWLTLDKTLFNKFEKILVIGNPPFGTSGKLAYDFLVESMDFADTVAFILPRGFKKDSMKNRIPLNFKLLVEYDLPKDSFTLEGEEYPVPCVFQIWEKSEILRDKVIYKNFTHLFKFTNKENADFRIQRVGGNAGKASLDKEASSASNYFVMNTSEYTNEFLIETINSLLFPSVDHTTGPRSLSKGELIRCIEEKLGIVDESEKISTSSM